MKSKFILTEKSTDKVFKSGLRLTVDKANTNPHKETLILPVRDDKQYLKKVDIKENFEKRKNDEDKMKIQNAKRYQVNESNTVKVKSNIYFNDFDTNPSISSSITSNLKPKVNSNNNFKESNDIDRTLVPSKSQMIRITQMIGSNPVNLMNKSQINLYNQANNTQSANNKTLVSNNIRNSNGMQSILKEKTKSNQSTIREAEILNSKVNNFSSSVLMSCDGLTEKKKTIKTFRHLFGRDNVGGFQY